MLNSIAVLRADTHEKLQTALFDMVEYANLTFADNPKEMNPQDADNILLSVMCKPLKTSCNAAAAVHLKESAGEAINRIRRIHPPAHIIIVSSRHEIFNDLLLKTVSRNNIEIEI